MDYQCSNFPKYIALSRSNVQNCANLAWNIYNVTSLLYLHLVCISYDHSLKTYNRAAYLKHLLRLLLLSYLSIIHCSVYIYIIYTIQIQVVQWCSYSGVSNSLYFWYWRFACFNCDFNYKNNTTYAHNTQIVYKDQMIRLSSNKVWHIDKLFVYVSHLMSVVKIPGRN